MRYSGEKPPVCRGTALSGLWIAIAVLLAVLGIAEEARATSTLGLTASHSQSSSDAGTGGTSESSQDKLSMYFKLSKNPSERLSLKSDIDLDVVLSDSTGKSSTEVQPKLSLRLSAGDVSLGLGYRTIYRDTSILSGSTTSEQHNEGSDLFFDTTIRLEKLPDIRARYGRRGVLSEENGVATSDTSSDDISVSLNYKIFKIAMSMDYRLQNSTDNLNGGKSKSEQMNAQASYSLRLGSKLKVSLRDVINISKNLDEKGGSTKDTEKTVNSAEAKAVIRPINRGNVTLVYKKKDLENTGSNKVSDTAITGVASYAFPKYLRFIGVYATREQDSGDKLVKSDVMLGRVMFKHRIKKFGISANYETRMQESNVTNTFTNDSGITTIRRGQAEITRNKLDWTLTYGATETVKFNVSGAKVTSERNGVTSGIDRYRFKVDIGPWKGFKFTPYYDYIINTSEEGTKRTSTELVALLNYRKRINDKIDVSFTDNYRTRVSGGGEKSESNNTSLRLSVSRLLKNVNMGVDLTHTITKTKGTQSDSTSMTYIMGWSRPPHRFSMVAGYRTASDGYDSYSLSLSYGVYLAWDKISCGLNASYGFSQALTEPKSTGQNIFMTLSVRK